MGFRALDYRDKVSFFHIISNVHVINIVYLCWYWPWSPRWCSVDMFLQPKVMVFFLSLYCTLWKVITRHSWDLCALCLRAEYLHKLFRILQGRFLSSPPSVYLFNHLYQYGLMDIYFILWAILYYYLIFLFMWKIFNTNLLKF